MALCSTRLLLRSAPAPSFHPCPCPRTHTHAHTHARTLARTHTHTLNTPEVAGGAQVAEFRGQHEEMLAGLPSIEPASPSRDAGESRDTGGATQAGQQNDDLGAGGAVDVEGVRGRMADARGRVGEWERATGDTKQGLCRATDAAVAALAPEHLQGRLAAPEVVVADALMAVDAETSWLDVGWWEGFSSCERRVDDAHAALVALTCRVSLALDACADAAVAVEAKMMIVQDAVGDPHEKLLADIASFRASMKKQERDLRDAKRKLEDAKEDVADAEDGDDADDAQDRLQQAEAAVDGSRRRLQGSLRQHRENLAGVSRLASSLFPELPWLMQCRGEQSHLAELFVHEPEAAALLAPDRKLSHYSNLVALSRTPDSRHDVDRASFDGSQVALKKYNLSRGDSLKTLRHELVVLSRLQHPNVIPVNLFLVEEAEGTAYVEFPLYECDMAQWLAGTDARPPPPYPDVFAAVHDVLRAVEHMHRAKVIHCDIRPKNVFMKQRLGRASPSGAGSWQAILADFDVSLDSGARATLLQTRTQGGARGFEGLLTMAPEVRPPSCQSCTPASDMFSFGGLLFVAFYPEIEPEMVQVSASGDFVVQEHEVNVDVAPLVRKLLSQDRRERPSASDALSYPLFAAAGAHDLAKVVDEQRALEQERRALSGEQRAARQDLAAKRARLQEEERQLERKVQQGNERLQAQRHKLLERGRQQDEAQKKLSDDLERVRREDAALKQEQVRSEKELRERGKKLREKEQSLARQRQQMQDQHFLVRPEHWSPVNAPHASGLRLERVRDKGVLDALQGLLAGTGIGDGGRDQQEFGNYSRLKLAGAWRVENDDLYRAYVVSRKRVLNFCARRPLRGEHKGNKARIRSELYECSAKLPWDLEKGCNEVRLLHGTKPELALSILQNGMNERFAGASAGTAFGDGSYFADDAGKIDQYVTRDRKYDSSDLLHSRLYSGTEKHPGNVFYGFVCRVALGHTVMFKDKQAGCFNPNARRRELCNMPNTEPPTPYHSLMASGVYRYTEYVVFHSDLTYPEYLLAFQRA